jgi:hypothetical protein
MIVAPNSPMPRANASAQPPPSPPAASGSAMRKNVRPGRRRASGAAVSDGSTASKAEIRGAEVERARDEDHSQDDGDLGERDLESEELKRPAEQPDPSERGEEPDPGDRRRAARAATRLP